uniref:Ubiquitin-like domain-containing protein n=1 Tax=Panagrolaimus superbus TaxID=310955 RepID=A0A914Y587_9BILA
MDNGKIHPFDVLSLDTVFVVKKKIFIKYGIPTRLQRLFFGAKQLEDGRTLADCLIKKSSFIQLSFGLPGGTRIEIKILAGDKVPTFSVSGDTVNEIKSDIFKQKSIPVDEQRLFMAVHLILLIFYYASVFCFVGEELLGISKVSHIQSKIVLICPKAKGVVFEVHTYKNQKIDLVVGDKETLYEIKAKIREIEDITVEQQKISFAGVYYQDYYMRAMKLCDVNDKTTATKIRQMVCDKPHHTQRIIFADISPSAIETLFVEEDSENNDNKVYYTPKKLIEKAFEYLSNHDPTIGSELAWAAAFYTIKLFYLRMGIHNISHRSIKWLAYTAIDTLQPKHQKKLKKLFARAESCHKYFNGSRDDEDILKYDIEDVENFVKKFQDIPHEPVEEKMKEFMRDNDKYDDGTIGYRLENKILSEFAGKFAVNTRVVFY